MRTHFQHNVILVQLREHGGDLTLPKRVIERVIDGLRQMCVYHFAHIDCSSEPSLFVRCAPGSRPRQEFGNLLGPGMHVVRA